MGRTALQFVGTVLLVILTAWRAAHADGIHDAAMKGDLERLERLLDQGLDLNADNGAGAPLHWAIFGNQVDAVALLLERGAEPDASSASGSPLQLAVISGSVETARLLLDHGADPNKGERSTPLIVAAAAGRLDLVELLLANGAETAAVTFEGITALHKAAERGHLEIAQKLVDHGADIQAVSEKGRPPIHFAVLGGHDELVGFLRQQGWQPEEVEPVGSLLADADIAKGEVEAQGYCGGCHHWRRDKQHVGVGPTLWDIVGREIGGIEGFTYSPSLGAQDGVWTYEALNRFIARPAVMVPGTAMGYRGLPERARRANLIAFLRTLSDHPAPLP